MSLLAFHGALRVNTNPYNPRDGVVRTVNLALDDPDNFGIDSLLSGVNISHGKQKDFQLVEALDIYSPRVRRLRSFGSRLLVTVDVVAFIGGHAPGDLSTGAQDLEGLIDDIDTMTGHQDGVSRYLWFSPNYRWNNPVEQWILMVPTVIDNPAPTQPKPWGRVYKLQLVSERNYKAIGWTEHFRGGPAAAGPGTVTVTMGSALVPGVGTTFRTTFIYGDQLLTPGGVLLGTVSSVTDDLDLVLTAPAAAGYAGAYSFQQRSQPSAWVPVYNLTEFVAHTGWGRTPWGEDWGSPSV